MKTAKPVKVEDFLKAQVNPDESKDQNKDMETELPGMDKSVVNNIPRGKPKSGRAWKSTRSERYSEMTLYKPLKSSWKTKMKARADKKNIKAFERELKEAKAKEQEEKRKKIEARKKLKEEMTQRAEITQNVKSAAKLKRIKKKQLRKVKRK